MEGWITLNRSLLDHELWQDEPFTRGQAWVDLLLLANHEPKKALIGGEVIELEVGSYVTTIRRLSERWFRSIDWVTKYLRLLESERMIQTKIVGKGKNTRTVLLLVNYSVYQFVANAEQNAERSSSDQVANAKRTQDGGKGVLDNNIYNTLEQQRNNEKGKTEKHITPNTLTSITPKGDAFEEDFSEFWNLYPKKDGRKNALQSYIKARKNGTDKETILSGLNAYVAQCERRGTEKRYIAMASTWLNQERWDWDYTEQETTKPHEETMEEKIARWRKEGLWNHE